MCIRIMCVREAPEWGKIEHFSNHWWRIPMSNGDTQSLSKKLPVCGSSVRSVSRWSNALRKGNEGLPISRVLHLTGSTVLIISDKFQEYTYNCIYCTHSFGQPMDFARSLSHTYQIIISTHHLELKHCILRICQVGKILHIPTPSDTQPNCYDMSVLSKCKHIPTRAMSVPQCGESS